MAEEKEFIGVNPSLARPLKREEKERAGWRIFINGEDKTDEVLCLSLRQKKMGLELCYGMRAEGYDGLLIHEPGGGGSVLVPYVIYGSELYVGLLEEERKTMGGIVLNLPRGFLDPGESHFETAAREFQEEAGVSVEKNRIVDLKHEGVPVNSNSAFFDTSMTGEGAHFYAVRFTTKEVLPVMRGNYYVGVFMNGIIKPRENDKVGEKIFRCAFHPWNIAVAQGDQFTISGVGRLLAYLLRTGEAKLLFY